MKRPYIEVAETGDRFEGGGPKQPRLAAEDDFSSELCCPPSTAEAQPGFQSFCDLCSEIDLDAIFSIEACGIPHHGRPVSSYRTTLSSGCRLCDMVKSLLDVNIRDEGRCENPRAGWHFRVFSCVKALRLRRFRGVIERDVVLTATAGEPKRFLGSVHKQKDFRSLRKVNGSLLRGYIAPTYLHRSFTDAAATVELWGNEVNQSEADFSLIRSWLQRDSSGPRSHKSSFRCQVIDCDKLEIVQHDRTKKYLALSYVWGTSETSHPEANLLVSAPQTVKDALEVTIRLGERYLWVDRYCIPDQKEKKHLHIANMNLIYAGAFATIVAANSGPMDSARAGLYGVSRPRNPQPMFHYSGRTYVSSLPHVSYHLAKSTWATRGWTYQEFILSSRCLFFTADQVCYASTETSRSESLLQYQRTRGRQINQTLGPSLLSIDKQLICRNQGNKAEDGGYISHLSEFMRRDLTYDLDILDAFRGVLGSLSGTSFYGVPVTYDDHSFKEWLDVTLLGEPLLDFWFDRVGTSCTADTFSLLVVGERQQSQANTRAFDSVSTAY